MREREREIEIQRNREIEKTEKRDIKIVMEVGVFLRQSW